MQNSLIDLSGLPEQVAADMRKLVQSIREQLAQPVRSLPPAPLPRWDGVVLGRMNRREIYGDGEQPD